MMGRHRRAHTGNKALQTRTGSPPVTRFVSSQLLVLYSGAQGLQEATPQDSVSCCLLDLSPSLSHSNNIRSHCKIHLTFSLSNQQSSVRPSVRLSFSVILRIQRQTLISIRLLSVDYALAVIWDHFMAATHHQILHVAMVISLTEYNNGTIHKLPVLS